MKIKVEYYDFIKEKRYVFAEIESGGLKRLYKKQKREYYARYYNPKMYVEYYISQPEGDWVPDYFCICTNLHSPALIKE